MNAHPAPLRTFHDADPPLLPVDHRALIPLATFAALWPVWRWFVLRLNDGSDEPLGLLALLSLGILLWPLRHRMRPGTNALIAATALLVVIAIAYPLLLPLPRAIIGLTALALAAGLARAPAGAWGLLYLSLPLMASLQFYLNFPLQQITARGAALLIELWPGIDVSVRGTVLHWHGNPVAVDPPCSGIKMLWVGGFVHFALATFHRLSWKQLIWLSPVALSVIIAANSLRAALLFPKESGAVSLPEWTHAGIGLVVFAAALALMARSYARLAPSSNDLKKSLSPARHQSLAFTTPALLTAAILSAITPLLSSDETGSFEIDADRGAETFFEWPDTFEGKRLTPVALSEHEKTFAVDFPGRLGVFDDSEGRRIILRSVSRATRKLHSSADCLRANGCAVVEIPPSPANESTTTPWRHYLVESPSGDTLHAREIIISSKDTAQHWHDFSQWFWSATRSPESGPWLAKTLIEAR